DHIAGFIAYRRLDRVVPAQRAIFGMPLFFVAQALALFHHAAVGIDVLDSPGLRPHVGRGLANDFIFRQATGGNEGIVDQNVARVAILQPCLIRDVVEYRLLQFISLAHDFLSIAWTAPTLVGSVPATF